MTRIRFHIRCRGADARARGRRCGRRGVCGVPDQLGTHAVRHLYVENQNHAGISDDNHVAQIRNRLQPEGSLVVYVTLPHAAALRSGS
jgi:hypothetical protein